MTYYVRVRFGDTQGEITVSASSEQAAIEIAKAKLPKRLQLLTGIWLVDAEWEG